MYVYIYLVDLAVRPVPHHLNQLKDSSRILGSRQREREISITHYSRYGHIMYVLLCHMHRLVILELEKSRRRFEGYGGSVRELTDPGALVSIEYHTRTPCSQVAHTHGHTMFPNARRSVQ